MYLKRLELIGFKSFADKTEFTFPSSVTAIVGPNGCGKSNVVDAFKWIFGEQSAKGLRGEEMKDVIFNGTVTRKPMGMSEVTVVFDNADRSLDIDYSEVAITRRLFRSGESEYLINKQKCRLRDIKELLLDTGLGTSSYAILEQGKIDVLLQASTLDRRIIFEEAAGISKYRVKKAETLRALQRTEENLARLGDIIDEVEKRMHRLKVQAGKARRYRECFDRMRVLRVRAALDDYRGLLEERARVSSRRTLVEQRLGRLEGAQRDLGARLEEKKAARRSLDERLAGQRRDLADVRTRRERTEERISLNGRRLVEIAGEVESAAREREASLGAREKLESDLEGLRRERDRAAGEIAGRRGLLEEKGRELAGLVERVEGIRQAIDGRRQAIVECLHERSRVGNRLVQLTTDLENLEGRRGRLLVQLEKARGEVEVQSALREKLEGELAGLRQRLDEIDRTRGDLDSVAEAHRREIAGAESDLQGLLAAIQDRRSRLDVLRSFEESREGIGKGVAAVLAAREGLRKPLEGGPDGSVSPALPPAAQIRGMVGEIIRVERRFARAVEAVLGRHAQSLVVETQEGGLGLLREIQEGDGGEVEVIALDRIGPPPGESPCDGRSLAGGGVLGLLRDRVETSPECREVVDRLLEGVILVEDLATAVALSRNGLHPFRLVTPDGAFLEPWGSMTLTGAGEAGGIISRRSEMSELSGELADLEKRLDVSREMKEEKVRSLQAIEGRLRQSLQAREAEALRIGSTETLLFQTSRDLDRAGREVHVGESELSDIALQEEGLLREREAAEAEARAIDRKREENESACQALEADLERASASHRQAGEAVTDLRVRLAEAEERDEGLRRSAAQLQETAAEEERRRLSLESKIDDLHRRHAETGEDLRASESALEEILASEMDLAARLEEAEKEDRDCSDVEGEIAAELERARGLTESCREHRERLNLREQEGKLKRNALVEKIDEEYGLDLAAIADAAATHRLPIAGGPAGGGAEGAPADRAASGAGAEPAGNPYEEYLKEDPAWDRTAADAEIHGLREKLRHMGNVNLEALDELDELEGRYKFLTGQRGDLRKAEEHLRQIIAEINRTSRELFLKTFESVQREFNEIFRKCFGGGMAELVLEDSADVLEAGIEIIARPPGKKLTSLSLMSGGEKTMTTIALLFAIFRSRPSPFCVLDEVDAPLDENNIRRFVVLLKDFVRESQFIIITHNKITMAEADTLYGVTMEERGVSKQVAVEFESYDPDHPETLMASGPAAPGDDVPGTSLDAEPV